MRQLLGTATIVLNSQFLMDQDKNQSELKYTILFVRMKIADQTKRN